ncbi:uncharacterized protein M6B38_183330 [Iris pallida]|uniref:Uncharacterized protein n=1 Tax=Iris pallida TaxID=29817 RepID=A0AAX6EKD4_IRIPA|nr:uncharacterized protein M6B38_183330 [Iris pallida]
MKGSGGYNSKNGDYNPYSSSSGKPSLLFSFPKLMVSFLLLISLVYFLYTITLFFHPPTSCHQYQTTATATATLFVSNTNATSSPPPPPPPSSPAPTSLRHIVFGIAASSSLWERRRDYIKLWWRPSEMRGFVWLDKPVIESEPRSLPELKISADTSEFPYTHRRGSRSALRISRIVSETFRLSLPDARWFVMGDDDTVFLPDNLLRVLSRLDHTQPYYIGSLSESHLQNIFFSYAMAYGGGGFAISLPLARSLSNMQDSCLRRYPSLYGSDDRIQACMAELGVPLTRHPGFHQYDVYGDLLGLLSAHPVAPLVSLHHLDVVEPIFPGHTRTDALRRLLDGPVRLDSAGAMQQSICYDRTRRWTVSVSWGFAVLLVRGVMPPREMETPARTFLNWYRRADYKAYAFNTRPVARNPCQKPSVYYLSSARLDRSANATVTRYLLRKEERPTCRWKMPDPSALIDEIIVYKKPDPALWDRSPRRNCCRVLPKEGRRSMNIDVGVCREGEISEA